VCACVCVCLYTHTHTHAHGTKGIEKPVIVPLTIAGSKNFMSKERNVEKKRMKRNILSWT